MLQYLQKQDCVQTAVSEGKVVYKGYQAAKIRVVAMPGPYSSERRFVDVSRKDVRRARTNVPNKHARTAANIGDSTQLTAQILMHNPILCRSLDRNCVRHQKMIKPPRPVAFT